MEGQRVETPPERRNSACFEKRSPTVAFLAARRQHR